ncbi:MAG: nucleotidyltransferase domain-containing protein [Candidatus Caenarcaniphilales bacterium]|nr:nucleotidyltransferase domain-containing protein [Candidatus Caenarcaniphilales bacterium]
MAKRLTDEELKDTLDDYLSALETEIKVDKALLFGSYAKGEAHEWSDIDLLIISDALPEDNPKGANGFYLDSLVGLEKVPCELEVIGVHPTKLESPVTKFFYDEIFKTGKEFDLKTKTFKDIEVNVY